MFRNFPLKLFSLFLAILFWIFVVSLENTFVRFPSEIPVQAVNITEELALTSVLPAVRVALRTQDPGIARSLSASDFEASVDLRNIGAGSHKVAVNVASKNPKVSVLRIEPPEIEVAMEPVREKSIPLVSQVLGKPAPGFVLQEVTLGRTSISVSGAESVLSRLAYAKAETALSGAERESVSRKAVVKIYDRAGVLLEGVSAKEKDIEAVLKIKAEEITKMAVVRARIQGVLGEGEEVSVLPAEVSLKGSAEALALVEAVETEPVELSGLAVLGGKKVRLVLPKDIALAPGTPAEVTVELKKPPEEPAAPPEDVPNLPGQ